MQTMPMIPIILTVLALVLAAVAPAMRYTMHCLAAAIVLICVVLLITGR